MSAVILTLPHAHSLRPTCCAPDQRGLALWLARRRLRLMLARELLGAPDSALQDAGWTRAALRQEIAKPMWRG
ncbi:DUF1127 domain-containing protein [Tritonibacter mobilis]|uniref:hypothetical protein n=1 Tax=Tritonibacter mobilis TaxID=379347 RepID=UPI001CD9ADB5|nr:hypothetical protein [Tritonibacter mobilis]MCA2008947.1 hypothetical protein [Tritonibacter mobilis]